MPQLSTVRALGGAVATLALVAACSGGASPAASVAASSPAVASPAASGGGDSYQLAIGSGAVGMYLTGEDGKTLYVFKNDKAGATDSACKGQCASNWPAFELEGSETATAGTGVTGTIATITRSDDSKKQVTYNGVPLYYFHGDAKAGDTNGQGVQNLWTVAAP
jgi:predicted lipoprotein with Yx(FWY)xxD motif